MRTHAPTVLYSEHLKPRSANTTRRTVAKSLAIERAAAVVWTSRLSGGLLPRIFVAVTTIHSLQLLRFVLAWFLAVVMV